MRFSSLFPLLAVSVAVVAGVSCTTEDQAPVFVDAEYQLRCIDCQPTAQDAPKRDIKALSGENNFSLDCFVNEVDGRRMISFSAQYTDPDSDSNSYALKVSQARLDGKDPGSECKVRVVEGGNTYSGDCTGAEPSEAQPCQLSFKVDGAIVNGSLLCDGIANTTASPPTKRYLVAPLTETEPVKIELHNCRGL